MKKVTIMSFSTKQSTSMIDTIAKEQMTRKADLDAWCRMESNFGANESKKYANENFYGNWNPELI